MEYCADCMLLCEGKCPSCGATELRAPEENDPVLLAEKPFLEGEILTQLLEESGIPFLKRGNRGAGILSYLGGSADSYAVFVPFAAMDRARELLEALETAPAVTEEEVSRRRPMPQRMGQRMRIRNEYWRVAVRKRSAAGPLDTDSVYTVLPNPKGYWAADPFLAEHGGKTYVFAELMEARTGLGRLGCCELTEGAPPVWRIIREEAYHLSYPSLYMDGAAHYMIPESGANREICVYRAAAFPTEWTLEKQLAADTDSYDSTVATVDGERFLLAYTRIGGAFHLEIYRFGADGGLTLIERRDDPARQLRPAGGAFLHEGAVWFPTQDSAGGYGRGVNFWRLARAGETLAFAPAGKLRFDAVRTDVPLKGLAGFHTYNRSDGYEVIDLRQFLFVPQFYVGRIRQKIGRLLHR